MWFFFALFLIFCLVSQLFTSPSSSFMYFLFAVLYIFLFTCHNFSPVTLFRSRWRRTMWKHSLTLCLQEVSTAQLCLLLDRDKISLQPSLAQSIADLSFWLHRVLNYLSFSTASKFWSKISQYSEVSHAPLSRWGSITWWQTRLNQRHCTHGY